LAVRVEDRSANRNAAFRQSLAGFSERYGEHGCIVEAQLRILRGIIMTSRLDRRQA
jgi:hypothetical protein